jgi:hypothetical protein
MLVVGGGRGGAFCCWQFSWIDGVGLLCWWVGWLKCGVVADCGGV